MTPTPAAVNSDAAESDAALAETVRRGAGGPHPQTPSIPTESTRVRAPRPEASAQPAPRASEARRFSFPPDRRWAGFQRLSGAVSRARGRAPLWLRCLTPLGWSVAGLGLVAWLVSASLGWVEFQVIAAFTLIALLASLPFLYGRLATDAAVDVDPVRVVAGGSLTARVLVRNTSVHRVLPMRAEIPVGPKTLAFGIPGLAAGSHHEANFGVPAPTRAVIDVGPIRATRGDALGMFRRTVRWGSPVTLFVHPRTVALRPLGSGLIRDFEGVTSDHLSNSDVAFHTLREYTPGDDRRHIHWRSSAKADKLLVRQFVDTRRNHVALLLDRWAHAYEVSDRSGMPPEGRDVSTQGAYEIGNSVAGSIAKRASLDGASFTLIAEGSTGSDFGAPPKVIPGRGLPSTVLTVDSPVRVLDCLAGLDYLPDEATVDFGGAASALLARHAAGASLVIVVTGVGRSVGQLRLATSSVNRDSRLLVIRVGASGKTSWGAASGLTIIDLAQLADLPRVLSAASR